jgi:hypothetical protein
LLGHASLLRARGKKAGKAYDIRGYTDDAIDIGIVNENLLKNFVNASIKNHDDELVRARDALVDELGSSAMVDAAAVIGNFECMNRIADACGIAVTGMLAKRVGDSADELNIRHYASARNTPGSLE